MSNLNFLLFCAFVWLSLTAIGNLTDGDNYLTQTDVDDIQTIRDFNIITQTDLSGNTLDSPEKDSNWIVKIVTADYSMFKDIHNLDSEGNPKDNDFVFIRYMIWIFGAALIIDLLIIARGLIFGR